MPRRIVLILWVLIGLLASVPARAADGGRGALAARLDAAARAPTGAGMFMGTVLVARDGQVILDKGYGLADAEWGVPNRPEAVFRIGSLTKQFTAALVLMLQEQGKLRLSDPVTRHLPDAPGAWSGITLAQLLGHVSGIPNFTSDERFGAWAMFPRSPDEELAFIAAKPLGFRPGERYEYSNSNYVVLGAVIEAASGMSYGDLLQQRILGPLGMKDSGLDTDTLIVPKHARGYTMEGAELRNARATSMIVPWAAGAMYSTTRDLLCWQQALFGGKLLSQASLDAMLRPGKGDYGLGVHVYLRDGATIVDHTGGIEGYTTFMAYDTRSRTVVITLGNIDNRASEKVGNDLLAIMLEASAGR